MRVLHLSDLHFGIEEEKLNEGEFRIADISDSEEYRRKFFKKIESLGKIDTVVITGDLINYKNYKDHRVKAKEFIQQLSEQVGVPIYNFIIIPGNHDVIKKESENVRKEIYKKRGESDIDVVSDIDVGKANEKIALENLSEREKMFADFISFCTDLKMPKAKLCKGYESYLCGVRKIVVGSETYNFIVLNSAWFAVQHGADDAGKLFIGTNLIRTMHEHCDVKKENNIILMHHDLSSLNEDERIHKSGKLSAVELLKQKSRLCLGGHVHNNNLSSIVLDNAITFLSIGAFHRTDEGSYSFAILDINDGVGKYAHYYKDKDSDSDWSFRENIIALSDEKHSQISELTNLIYTRTQSEPNCIIKRIESCKPLHEIIATAEHELIITGFYLSFLNAFAADLKKFLDKPGTSLKLLTVNFSNEQLCQMYYDTYGGKIHIGHFKRPSVSEIINHSKTDMWLTDLLPPTMHVAVGFKICDKEDKGITSFEIIEDKNLSGYIRANHMISGEEDSYVTPMVEVTRGNPWYTVFLKELNSIWKRSRLWTLEEKEKWTK